MAVPKRKISKARRDKRRNSHWKLDMPGMSKSPLRKRKAQTEQKEWGRRTLSSFFLKNSCAHSAELTQI